MDLVHKKQMNSSVEKYKECVCLCMHVCECERLGLLLCSQGYSLSCHGRLQDTQEHNRALGLEVPQEHTISLKDHILFYKIST